MFSDILLSFLPYACVTAFTPGPNNILALTAISNQGWNRGKHLVGGILAGFVCVMFFSALGCFALANFLPLFSSIMKYIGAAYIIWLAINIACSPPASEKPQKETSFWNGFILQFVNVKTILSAITIYTSYIIPVVSSVNYLLLFALLISVLGVIATMTWAVAGGVLQKYINNYYRIFNISMALILVWSAVSLLIY